MGLHLGGRGRVIAAVTSVLFVAPMIYDVGADWRRRPFSYLAADAFYYLTIGRNWARTGHFTYDGTYSTNGFHPLWQLVIGVVHFVANHLHFTRAMVLVAMLLSAIAITAALFIFITALADDAGDVSPLVAILPVGGVYGLCAARMWYATGGNLLGQSTEHEEFPVYGTLWSFVNGMETPLVLLFFALSFWLVMRRSIATSRRDAVSFGLCLAGLSLARLDHAIFALMFVVGLGWATLRAPALRPRAAEVAAAWLAPFAVYLIFNTIYYHSPVPLSGATKSTFPWFGSERIENLHNLLKHPGHGLWLGAAFRQTQMILPAIVAVLYIPCVLRLRALPAGVTLSLREGERRREDAFWLATAVGVIGLALYNFLYVELGAQGHWYFPVSCLFMTFAPLSLASRWRWVRRPPLPVTGLVLAASTALALVVFFHFHRRLSYHSAFADLYWIDAPLVHAHYGSERPHLLENDDGIVAYSLDYPTMSWTGLATDPGAAADDQPSRFQIAFDRGFDRITTDSYLTPGEVKMTSTSEQLHHTSIGNPSGHAGAPLLMSTDYVSASGQFVIVRVQKP